MTAELRVGCAMWANKAWVGRFLSPRGNHLADYATWCNAVEGNTTFYATPSASTVARWVEDAPPDFRFAFKVPRTITHERRLTPDAHRDLAAFLTVIEPLGDRIGPLQLQLPPSFGPESLHRLRSFVVGLPMTHRWVVEFRHRSYYDGSDVHRAADDALATAGLGRVVLDTRGLYATPAVSSEAVEERRTKPSLPIVTDVMGDEPVVRVIGGDHTGSTAEAVAAWSDAVLGWLAAGRRPYVFAHQPHNRDSPALAREFHDRIAARLPGLAPLPDPIEIAGGPAQSALF